MKLNRLIAITRKEAIQIRRDPRSLLIVFLMPVMLMALMGYGINLDQKNVPMCVFDREGSQQSQNLLKDFQASDYFKIVMVNENYSVWYRRSTGANAASGWFCLVTSEKNYSRAAPSMCRESLTRRTIIPPT